MRDIREEYKSNLQTLEVSINNGVGVDIITDLVVALLENAYIKGQADLLSTSQE